MKNLMIALVALLAVAVAVVAYLAHSGLVVVRDTSGQVWMVVIRTGGDEQQYLHKVGNSYVGIPGDGAVEVRCKGGSDELLVANVTHGVQTRAVVDGCRSANFHGWIGFPWG